MSRSYVVYKHTSPSNKTYIGITNDYNNRCATHKYQASKSITTSAFHNAIRKYGWDNFKHEIVADNLTQDEASLMEIILIRELNTQTPNGYNICSGGGGCPNPEYRFNRLHTGKGYNYRAKDSLYCVERSYYNRGLAFGSFKDEDSAKMLSDEITDNCATDEELLDFWFYYRYRVETTRPVMFKGSSYYCVYRGIYIPASKDRCVVERARDTLSYEYLSSKLKEYNK